MGLDSTWLWSWCCFVLCVRCNGWIVSIPCISSTFANECSSGVLLWWQFLGLDSDKYPVKNYGDLGFRIYGNWLRYIINILQSGQFFLGVTLLIVVNGQGLSQLSQGPHGSKALCCKFMLQAG